MDIINMSALDMHFMIEALRKALERIIDADTVISDGGKVHDHGRCAEIAMAALSDMTKHRSV